ncbi:MAG: protein kinase [Actinomycetota bacterium]
MIRTVESFHRQVAEAAVGAGGRWRIEPPTEERSGHDEPWIRVEPEDAPVASRGWKLHVSATPWSAAEVLERSLPILLAAAVPFKIAASAGVLFEINEGVGGLDQIGKFVTAYPATDEQAVRLAGALHESTAGLRGPSVPTDTAVADGSLVHYRYGDFRPPGPEANAPHAIPVERDVVDAPSEDPFRAAGLSFERRSGPVGGRYVPLTTLYRSPRGTVAVAVDVEGSRRCVLKRAAHDVRVAPDGSDARDNLRDERDVLVAVAGAARVPAVHDLVEHEGDLVLVMEHVEGATLADLVSSRPSGGLPAPEVVGWGRAIATAVRGVHERGYVFRDLNPGNVIVVGPGDVCIVDFEMAQAIPDGPFLPAGSPGYSSPQQAAGHPGAVEDDVYSLGAVLLFLATGEPPSSSDELSSRAGELSDPVLRPVIERCLELERTHRYASMSELEVDLARRSEALGPM